MKIENRKSIQCSQTNLVFKGYFRDLNNYLLKQCLLSTSSALLIALSVSPVYAESQLPISDSTATLNTVSDLEQHRHSAEALELEAASLLPKPAAEPAIESHIAEIAFPLHAMTQADTSTLQPSQLAVSDRWQFSVEPYVFVPFRVQADATVAGRSASIELGLGNILNFDRAFNAGIRLEAQKNRLGLIFDGFYVSAQNSGNLEVTFPPGSLPGIGANIPIPVQTSADASLSIRQGLIDLAASYRVVDTTLGDSAAAPKSFPRLVFAPSLGLRINILSQKLEVDDVRINNIPVGNLPLPISLPVNQDFRLNRTTVEPLIGAQIGLDLSERWTVDLRGDVSGFNLNADTNLTWNLLVGAQYQLSPNTSLQLSYRFNGFDFEDGSGLTRANLNLRQNGLLLGATFHF
ncbi:outer membrane protein [Gloeocapsa sp. PCC 7428]|uniref:outer membrane protein n=1 Tax=Gloeocapsa sp. PCC 7428 TaxID=1173026 RepID=UPI0018C8CDD4|nr:outer membrane beta-barrel protein [Gloeocapsa sp. PCC 7428]